QPGLFLMAEGRSELARHRPGCAAETDARHHHFRYLRHDLARIDHLLARAQAALELRAAADAPAAADIDALPVLLFLAVVAGEAIVVGGRDVECRVDVQEPGDR